MSADSQIQPTSGVLDGREHRLPVRVYYEDTDFTGVVYHANYLRYFERGRSEFLRVLGAGNAALLDRPDPVAFAIIRLAIDFRRAARIDDALVVNTTWEAIKGPRLAVRQWITRGDDLIAEVEGEAICITPAGRPRRLPADLVAAFLPYLA
jgi:acyl-CoA thioester hydrolase